MFPTHLVLSGIAAALLFTASPVRAVEPLYQNDFQKAEAGKLPENFLVVSGAFAVQAEGEAKYLELPGAPLEEFGLLFGPSQPPGGTVAGKFLGTKQGRKFPAFALSLGGVGGYRLQVSAAKKALEIVRADETRATVPYTWESGAWTLLKLQVLQAGTGWTIQGKAWPAGTAEPAAWSIQYQTPDAPPAGRAALWGTPYAGTPIRFDDLLVEPGT